MSKSRTLGGLAAGLTCAGLYAGTIAYEAGTEILVILGAAIGIAFAASFLLATTRAGPLVVPALIIFGYVAVLVWIVAWLRSCPDCTAGYETQRDDAGVGYALIYGVAFLMPLGAALAGSAAGVATRQLSARLAPSG